MFRVNEIFRSIQGEGYHTGLPVVFIRFAGCNQRCSFCDTDHDAVRQVFGTSGALCTYLQQEGFAGETPVVLTGGEPAMQIDRALLGDLLTLFPAVHIETNGTLPISLAGINTQRVWITVSPKGPQPGWEKRLRVNEVKVLDMGQNLRTYTNFYDERAYYFLQPVWGEDVERTVKRVIDNPPWRLSIQTHKYIGVR